MTWVHGTRIATLELCASFHSLVPRLILLRNFQQSGSLRLNYIHSVLTEWEMKRGILQRSELVNDRHTLPRITWRLVLLPDAPQDISTELLVAVGGVRRYRLRLSDARSVECSRLDDRDLSMTICVVA